MIKPSEANGHNSKTNKYMGVISCDRKDCTNIMCDVTIECAGNHGRSIDICNECIEDFKRSEYAAHITCDQEARRAVAIFINRPKTGPSFSNTYSLNDFFRKYDRRNPNPSDE